MSQCTGRPADEWLEPYLQGTLPAREQEAFEEHYFDCPVCLAQVQALQAVQMQLARAENKAGVASLPSRAWSMLPGFVWAGLAAAGVVLAFIAIERHHTSASSPVMLAELHDDGGEVGLDVEGHVIGIPSEYSTLVAQALRTRRLPLPSASAEKDGDDVLRGESAAAPAFHVLSPLREVTMPMPEFQWQPLPNAKSYRVEIYEAGYRMVAQSPAVEQTSWKLTTPLTVGQSYIWVVKAETAAGPVPAPQAPVREARFTVADAKTLGAIEAARRQYPDSHLLLASLYAQAGMTSEAREQMAALESQNAGSGLVRDLSLSLEPGAKLPQPPSSTKPAQ